MHIQVKEITPEQRALETKVNEQVRIVNCLARQLFSQQQAILNSKKRQEGLLFKLQTMERVLKLETAEIQTAAEQYISAVERSKGISPLQLIKKRRMATELRFLQRKLERAKTRYAETEKEYEELKNEYDRFPKNLEDVIIPNLNLHIEQLKAELQKYESVNHMLFLKTGKELPIVKFEDIIVDTADGIQIKRIDEIQSIKFEKFYKPLVSER